MNGFYGNNFGGYGNPALGVSYGYIYQQPQQPPVFNQLLTADEMAKLQKNPNSFSTKLTEEAYLRAICTHKDHQNYITLEKLPNGKHRCSICQSEFYLVDLNTTKEEIEATCNNIYDLLQSIKTYYGNTPYAMREFYLMIGFIPKIKELWEVAKTYFDKATGGFVNGNAGNDQSGFAILSNIFGNGAMAGIAPGVGGGYYGGYQQPWYGGAPVPQSAPMQTPGWGTPGNPMGAPMPPAQAPAPGATAPNSTLGQTPMYGYNPTFAAPAPSVPGAPGIGNPIGYVDNSQNYAPQTSPAGQPSTQPQPPMPAAPTNPNLEQNKAEVGKTFAG
jgi:hypothetical protein